jgi:hypothetical protein
VTDGSSAAADERLADASLLIGLLEYDLADELLRGVLRDARAAGDDQLASRALEALGTIATRRGREAEARRLMEQGDAAGALRALDRVRPEEPAYPFARQLRRQAESALRPGRWN